MERLKSTLFCTVDCQHLKTRLLSTDSFPLYRRVQGRSEMMEHEFLEQFISLTTTKLTANVYTEFSPYLSCKMSSGNVVSVHLMLHDKANQAITRKNDYKCIYRIITLSLMKMTVGAFFLYCIECYMSKPIKCCVSNQAMNQAMNQKGDCGLLQSESLFAAALNQRGTYFRTLSHKTCVNANPPTGPNDA